jgi:hypothetical protein
MHSILHVKYRYSCHILIELELFSIEFRKILKNQIPRKSDQWEPSYAMRTMILTDRQTEVTKLTVAFRSVRKIAQSEY